MCNQQYAADLTEMCLFVGRDAEAVAKKKDEPKVVVSSGPVIMGRAEE